MAVSPFGNFLGGVLCEFIDARKLIIINAVVAIVIVLVVLLNPKVKEFLNGEEKLDADPDTYTNKSERHQSD